MKNCKNIFYLCDTVGLGMARNSTLSEQEKIEVVRDFLSGASVKELSAKHNVSMRTISEWNSKFKHLADLKEGFIPQGHDVRGTSTLYDAEGNMRLQWVKTNKDIDRAKEVLEEYIGWLAESVKEKAPLKDGPEAVNSDLLTVYPLGDPHFGLYAWEPEAGENFDLDEAERRTCAAVDRLVSSAPSSEVALFINLGDFYHADNSTNETPFGKNKLDVDGRFFKVAQVGLRAMTHCIERLREKHKKVIVWNIPGNHDPHQSLMLALCLSSFYQKEKNIDIVLSPNHYQYHRFGKVLIAATHGHGAKMPALPLLMAADRPDDWGATEHRYWYCGHIHHKTSKEHPGVTVETFRTLAGADAWHAQKGYRAGKDMQMIVHHKDYGEIERHTCSIKEILNAKI